MQKNGVYLLLKQRTVNKRPSALLSVSLDKADPYTHIYNESHTELQSDYDCIRPVGTLLQPVDDLKQRRTCNPNLQPDRTLTSYGRLLTTGETAGTCNAGILVSFLN